MPWRPRVLVVDDEELVVAVLEGILERLGVEAVESAHSFEAAAALLDGPVRHDLAFVDLRLGQTLSGIELARTAAARGVLVVAMTGERTLPEGLDGAALLTKPFSVETVRLVFDTMARQR
ncbi:MAG TPA: response regulator [Candidatus Sulfotelmatobacter sp.]|nr:response regulator [Candidatus Sulfotelmatobacter sp.]